MSSQQVFVHQVVRSARRVRVLNLRRNVRVISSSVTRSAAAAPKLKPTSSPPSQSSESAPQREQSWLTTKVKSSPLLFSIFLSVARALGYGSPQQFANRRALHFYNTLCATRADQESAFWREGAMRSSPNFSNPGLQSRTSMFGFLLSDSVPSLHHTGHSTSKGSLITSSRTSKERLRAVLQPGIIPPRPSSPHSPNLPSNTEDGSYLSPYPYSSFYTTPIPLAPKSTFPSTKAYQEAVKLQKRSRAPEKLITRQMKILKEQWAGMGMSLDLGLVKGDAEMAAAIWRNLLGARGASGIGLNQEGDGIGGLVEDVRKVDVDKEELKDDNSGVHDFAPSENDRYITYPELMATLVSYIRRESVRLERLDDNVIMGPRRVGREG
ncbi:hypothetical protein DFH29DRAFT_1000198 [Suillus ampliporus]|nr:hypothetical protein DFH29DRAFT_1000198 [Suillus ampliporus]